ncbi:MAG: ImmA/IrrE family metallo-endopeptidase [Proteobacteria bacterium]|nr:ImmA/IrrE family metallo-endopeptidase [Pseudomonadota bacterium]
MNLALRLKRAQQEAEKLLRDESLESVPVDVLEIAASRNILVQPKPDTHDGVSGMLVRHGNHFGILYATFIKSQGFQRFSIAHELGHYFLAGHSDHVLKNGAHQSLAEFRSVDTYEQEADAFAVGLLMPTGPFQRELRKRADGLKGIEEMAALCVTSMTSTAIRYAELTRAASAVIVSTGTTIDFCRMSENLKLLKGLQWLKKGTPLPGGTLTSSFNLNEDYVAHAKRDETEIDIRDWLGGTRRVMAQEEVIGLGSYGRTLTVLTCPGIEEEAYGSEEDDEDKLIESWTPRFRK